MKQVDFNQYIKETPSIQPENSVFLSFGSADSESDFNS